MKEFYSQQHHRMNLRFVHAIWPSNHKCETKVLVTASKVHEFYISFIHLLSPKWNVESMFTYMYVNLYTDIICIYVIFTIIHVNTLAVIKMQM